MALWIIFALLTATALTVVLWPFMRAGRPGEQPRASDTAVYRDQLDEIGADLSRGLIGKDEAQAARTEISRRLLAASEVDEDPGEASRTARSGAVAALAAVAAIPVLSLGLYLAFGSPALPDRPIAQRHDDARTPQRFAELVRQVEERLRAHPEDGRGWDVIAPVYLKEGRYAEAADAYRRALRLLGEDTRRLVGYGEALVLANNGIVSEEARKAFDKALQREASLPKARFWVGVAAEQDGRFDEAVKLWRDMLSGAPEDAPWRLLVQERLRLAETRIGVPAGPGTATDPAPVATPGPTQDDIAAAKQMTPAQRTAMINRMVEGLADRLKDDGGDLQGWLRLVRAYTVLGERDKAIAALKSARANFNDDPSALGQLAALEKSLGL